MSTSHGRLRELAVLVLMLLLKETLKHHNRAFSEQEGRDAVLDSGGEYQWRKDGEDHLFSPQTMHALQMASRTNDYRLYKKFSELVKGEDKKHLTLRSDCWTSS